ncbi:hypothetical protein VTN77DRAFT_6928 [Rasamsonia byssochlamydoides]|uniref:uncharacterized protein n=1 Tax=Rasamsonia byssochlamydoides TaxID=89139 RepID=UPI0037434A66
MSSPTTTTVTTTTTSTSTASATCVSIPPGKDGYLPPEACGNILFYVPSYGAAVFFVILFSITMIVHGVQMFAYKKKYCWVIVMGAAWELVAMIFRVLLTKHQNNTTYNTYNQLLFLLAPLWINAFLYMTLGRMLWFFDETQRLGGLSPQRFGTAFVALDIVSFIVQAAGASITTSSNVSQSTLETGIHIYMGGIGLQEFFILGFIGLMVTLHRRLIQQEQRGVLLHRLHNGSLPWRWLFYGMYFALVMITVRIIYRLVEYAAGTTVTNPLITHEAYEYVLDALPMFLALAVLNFTHPGRIINGPDASWPRLSRREKKALKQQRKAEKAARRMSRRASQKDWNNSDVAFESLRPAEEGVVENDRQEYSQGYGQEYRQEYTQVYGQEYRQDYRQEQH